MKDTKDGRLRRYELTPYSGAKNGQIGYSIAILNELSERMYDQISDLPVEALSFVPRGSYLSIGKLVVHLASSEAHRVSDASGRAIPADLQAVLSTGAREHLSRPLDPPRSAEDLIALSRRLRTEFTIPALSSIDDFDAAVDGMGPLNTVRKIIMQLVWHSIYHSGHIGLTRLLWGSDYNWRY